MALLVVTFGCEILTSCGGGDDDEGGGSSVPQEISGIVGSWYSVQTKNTSYAGKFCNIRVVTLNPDYTGTFTWAQYNYDDNELKYIERYSGSYVYSEYSGYLRFPGSTFGELDILEVNTNSITYEFIKGETENLTRGTYNWTEVSGGTIKDESGTIIQGGSGSGSNSGSGGSSSSSTDPQWGKVTGTLKASGPGVSYSSVASTANGRTTTVDYVYYPTTGKYYVYGGAWDSSSSANGGKGLRYDAQKGYNSIKINAGAYYDSSTKIKYNWELYLRVTIP